MSRCGPNLQTPGSCFHPLTRQIASLALKMERKNINQCLGGLRMEDKGERSPQTFIVNNLSFLQLRRKQADRCAFKRVLNTDSGLKAAAWTLENKTGDVHISSKLNSVFSTIRKAIADKITAKLVGKTHAFTCCVNN